MGRNQLLKNSSQFPSNHYASENRYSCRHPQFVSKICQYIIVCIMVQVQKFDFALSTLVFVWKHSTKSNSSAWRIWGNNNVYVLKLSLHLCKFAPLYYNVSPLWLSNSIAIVFVTPESMPRHILFKSSFSQGNRLVRITRLHHFTFQVIDELWCLFKSFFCIL